MTAQAVKAVIFDLGGVLIEWDPTPVFREQFPDDAEGLNAFLHGPFRDVALTSCESTEPFDDLLPRFRRKYPEAAHLFDLFGARWHDFVQAPMPASIAVLDALVEAGTPVFALTNWPAETFPPRGADYAFLEAFGDIVVSGEVGLRKPDAAIYRLALDRFGLDPSEVLFVDDLAGNVEAAAALGMAGHHFQDAASLRREVSRHGLC